VVRDTKGGQRFRETGVSGRLFYLAKGKNMDATETMDIFAVCEFLKVSKWTIYQLTRKNKIPCHRPTGKKLIFFRNEIEEFVRGKDNSK